MARLPSVFISHGAPTLPIDPSMPSAEFATLADRLPRPRAILMLSAHWGTMQPLASIATRPETIHDFYGFPPALYELRYPAPGAPELGARAAELLNANGVPAATADHGLDHGAWVPLLLMFPEADVPVAQLSIQPRLDAAHHYRVGRALRALRDEGVMIVGSGQITHNLRAADFGARPEDADPRVTEFTDWFEARLAERDIDALLDYRRRAPHAVLMHPTDEHLLPVFSALGAASDDFSLGIQSLGTFQKTLAMTNYVFGDA
ncbi:extradiol ring-cleavage dioxygenase III subunit B [Caballeronia arationis]|jgi:4,5-DOPA dioxygenase extradiol|uniref:Aromatic ring-opening dioxygenase, catalytic subunit, LigB family n=1 Tax=Caballeronia arationis TaxID=1777142 RepID=A0A7Z7I6V3_9BURK|nr:class III extradiol ring-cleavage dioxygenase [Caballeronia arationis]SAK91714.1 extradiol ring-cleavage dioxygenase III subunit B [Caballeronia arationis]SOE80385.1 Aromatic ring-opening dioxygenase, catalytic subunit, LigB family [Caballeronia arationis]